MNQCEVNNSIASTSITTATSTSASTSASTNGTTNGTSTNGTSTESFVADIFTKHSANYNKTDVLLGNNIKPQNSSKFW